MKKYKSGAQKRKEATLAKESAQKLSKVTHYFSAVSTCVRDDINQSETSSLDNAETEPFEIAPKICPKRQYHFHNLLSSPSLTIQYSGLLLSRTHNDAISLKEVMSNLI